MRRRHALGLVAAALLPPAVRAAESAQQYPSRQIRLISPYGAGGGNDTIARLLARGLGNAFGQSVIVDNRPGANTIIGNEMVAKAPPDGYTLILNGNGFVTNPSFYSKIPFDTANDFAPVAFVAFTELVLVCNASVPARNVKELIALAKAEPGSLNFANSGNGGPEHLASVMFGQLAGVDIPSIPYKGAAAAITDMVGGQVQLMITALAAVQPFLQNGQLRLLAVANRTRSSQFPDTPTIAESGLPSFETSLWYGLMAPAATPPPIVDRLNLQINKILLTKEIADAFATRGLKLGDPAVVGTPALFRAFIKSELAKSAQVAKAANIKPE